LLPGYPEFFLSDYDTIKPYEQVLFYQVSLMVEPYVITTLVLIFLYNLIFLNKVKKIKKYNFKQEILCYLNICIFIFYIISLIATLISFTISKGILG